MILFLNDYKYNRVLHYYLLILLFYIHIIIDVKTKLEGLIYGNVLTGSAELLRIRSRCELKALRGVLHSFISNTYN